MGDHAAKLRKLLRGYPESQMYGSKPGPSAFLATGKIALVGAIKRINKEQR